MILSQDQILAKILKDREKRFALRQTLAKRNFASISLNFNIPGYPKSSKKITAAFYLVVKELQNYLIANRITLKENTKNELHTNCGNFFIQAVEYTYTNKAVKSILEQFEQTHDLGRLLDVDLFSSDGKNISSKKQKKCFLCNDTAYNCMQNNTHTFKEYQLHINKKIVAYLVKKRKDEIVNFIAEQAVKATLFEISTEQKPGLVCPSSNGAHTDMDFFTFLASSSALAPYWYKLADYGYSYAQNKTTINYSEAIINLRILGLEAETAMARATKNINTHKGIIFLLGHACFTAGVLFALQNTFTKNKFKIIVKQLAVNLVKEDYENRNFGNTTHGAFSYKKYGKKIAGGARYEVEQGFPLVFKVGLPMLKAVAIKFKTKEQWQPALQTLLLSLIAVNNDTNILYRKDKEYLQQIKKIALQTLDKKEGLQKIINYCKKNNISPGGSADMLAVTLFVYFIATFKAEIPLEYLKID